MKLLGTELAELALALADSASRADVECRCLRQHASDGWWCDTSKPDTEYTDVVRNALRYIELRGDEYAYIVHRDGALIRFEERP